ncbi:MAG: ABC transporter permease [Propionibacteriaceae bacterium]|jgi:ribose transport system permease protein|nr:ABC transporter permease [Propionibacteriaceae bacterium]
MSLTSVAEAPKTSALERYKGFVQQGMVLLVLVLLFVFFSVMNPNFLTWGNVSSLLLASVVTATQAIGLTFVIATGGIDLTPGMGMLFCMVVLAVPMTAWGAPVWVGVVVGLLAGALLGTVNGVLISVIRMQPMIATLAMMLVCWGFALLFAGAKTLSLRDVPGFTNIAMGQLLPGLYNGVIILVFIAIVAGVLMNKTVIGRYALAIGSNKEATRISGINTQRWEVLAYTICGVFTGISGIIMAAYLNSVPPNTGQSYEMYAIAAAVIGGTSLRGGRASVFGAVIGAVTIRTIYNGLTILGFEDAWQKVVLGFVILIAVFVDIRRRGGEE